MSFLISGIQDRTLVHPAVFLVVNVDNMTASTETAVSQCTREAVGSPLCRVEGYPGGYSGVLLPGGYSGFSSQVRL